MNKDLKFYEMVSAEKGTAFEMRGYKFQYERYTAYFADKLLAEHHVSFQELMGLFEKNPYGVPLDLAFALLDEASQEQFNNDLETFKKSLSDNEVVQVIEALQATMTDAEPSKNSEAV